MMDDLSPNLRLETFWNCLDERQKHDLKQIKSSALIDKQCCKYCQDLLRSSMQSLDKDANIAWHKLSQSHKHYLKIFVTPTGDFVPETSLGQFIEKDEVRPCYSIDVTQGPSYNVNDEAADYIVSGICKSVDPDKKGNSGKKSKKGKKGKGKKGRGNGKRKGKAKKREEDKHWIPTSHLQFTLFSDFNRRNRKGFSRFRPPGDPPGESPATHPRPG